MTINGPAPTILAMFLNTAVDQQVERYLKDEGLWRDAEPSSQRSWATTARATSRTAPTGSPAACPKGTTAAASACSAPRAPSSSSGGFWRQRRTSGSTTETLQKVRGTVQADILKEDQAQNTCIFSTEFSLKLMGDVQQAFIDWGVRNFYSVSISGYHIAEAGANPISQLAFTLANGFTYVEAYRARGMDVDAFAPNLSFFFSNGMDAEYTVLGRVARRIWSVAMRDLYGADERSQKLKYHIQTCGRSLHAQEIQFNDIRTTLQALLAIYDNTNSLHTNAYDEAITTPTEESVRRAMAIQLIINRELGLAKNENPLQGAFIVDELTDLVEEAVLARVRADLRPRRRPRRDGDHVPARQDPGGVDALRAPQALGRASRRRRQHVPRARGGGDGLWRRAHARERRGEAAPARRPPPLPVPPRRRGARGAGAAPGRRAPEARTSSPS